MFVNYVLVDQKKTFSLLFHNNQKIRDFMSVYLAKMVITCLKKETEEEKLALVSIFVVKYL